MKTNKDTLLGIVFFLGLGLILVATAQLKNWTAFEKPVFHDVFFSSADGLRAGDAVTVYGMRAGRVKEVKINPSQDRRDKRIVVTLETKAAIPFTDGVPYEISIEDSSFLGGKVVTVNPEATKGGIPYRRDEPLMGVSFSNPLKQLSNMVGEASGDIKGLISGLSNLVKKANAGESTIGALFNERDLYDSLADSADRLNGILKRAEAGEGTVGALLKDRQPFDDLKAALGDLKQTTKALNDRKSLLSKVIHDSRMGDNAAAFVEDLRTLVETARQGKGTLGKLVMNDGLHQDLQETIREARDLIHQARTGKGIVPRLISDQALGDKMARLISSAENVLSTISRGEGTLGRLVKDDALYAKLNLVVRQISGAIEDAREAAPVTTFISILGSSFR